MALLAFACSVYEVPSENAAGTVVQTAEAGSQAQGSSSHGGSTSPSAGASPVASGGSSGAETGASAPGGTANAGGETGVDPYSGGEGGAPAVPDGCPKDSDKLAPGECGCGVPEAPSATMADCHTLKSLLVHRYDFEGSGTDVKDRVGSADGVVARGSLDGKGVLALTGGDIGPYVDLPNGILSSLKNATLEAWVTWGGGGAWQRIFDFGDSNGSMPENSTAGGKTYLFVTPQSSNGVLTAAYSLSSVAQETAVSSTLPLGQALQQVVVVADDDADLLQLYVDGVKVSEQAWSGQLSKINDVNVWLGRSQNGDDQELNAVYHEFRMYGAALSAAQVAAAFNAGTDPAFLAY